MRKGLLFISLIVLMMSAGAQGFLHKAAVDGRVDSVRAAINLPQEFTGQGVIIGITDWGFDYTHPVFYDTLMQNYRVLRAWDQFKTSGPAPAGYTYGTEYVGKDALLAAQCDTSNVYKYAYHGTHCAGIAGGAGAGTIYRGVAVEAEYLFVSVSLTDQEVIDAWRWMYDVAQQEGKRLVISMSWGLYYLDNMDGTGPLAEEMQRLNDLGVVFVSSAGNNGEENLHLTHTFTQQDTIHTQFTFAPSSTSAACIGADITMMNSENTSFSFSLMVMNSAFDVLEQTPFLSTTIDAVADNFLVVNNDTIFYHYDIQSNNPYNNKPIVQFRVMKNTTYRFGLAIAAESGEFHAWNLAHIESNYGNWGGEFKRPSNHTDWIAGDAEYGVSTPANIDCAISVAAHSSRYQAPSGSMVGGAIASFSSYGPGFGQSLKPDISAPGKNIVSSLSSYTNTYSGTAQAQVQFNDRTYKFVSLSGTSMAGPFVAGVAALVLQVNPYLSASQVKDILLQTAYHDQYTDQSGEIRFGHGKVNAYQAVLHALYHTGAHEFASNANIYTVFPNPATDQILISTPNSQESATARLYDLNGRLVQTLSVNQGVNTMEVGSFPNGTYILKISNSHFSESKKMVIAR